MFYRMARFREFDVSELSLSTYTVLRGRGEPLVAIPVFPSFSFRHASVFVGTHAGIKEPRELVGKRMGVPKYHMTGHGRGRRARRLHGRPPARGLRRARDAPLSGLPPRRARLLRED